jgi:hypothetical protein
MGIDKHAFGGMRSVDTQAPTACPPCPGRPGRDGRSYRLPGMNSTVLGAGSCGNTHDAAHARGGAECCGPRREGKIAAADGLDVVHTADSITVGKGIGAFDVRVARRVVFVAERRADAGPTLPTVVHLHALPYRRSVEDEVLWGLQRRGGVATVGSRRGVTGVGGEGVNRD